jgi:phage terminase small subunit
MSQETKPAGQYSLKKTRNHGPKKLRPRVGPDGLTIRERAFVAAFVQTLAETNGKGNQTKAALMIGCPPAGAATRGCNFMKMEHIKSAIAVHVDQMVKTYDITTENILSKLRSLAYTGMSKFARKEYRNCAGCQGKKCESCNFEGIVPTGELRLDFSDATDDELDALTELVIEEYQEGKGDQAKQVKKTRIKMDRRGALDLLGKYKEMWTDKLSLQNPDGSAMQAPVLNIIFKDSRFTKPVAKE